jgi:hypothetical protein
MAGERKRMPSIVHKDCLGDPCRPAYYLTHFLTSQRDNMVFSIGSLNM